MDTTTRQQATIATAVSVSGFGFWSGQDVTLRFEPAAENTGLVFVRTDVPNQPEIPAKIRYRVQGPRRTTLVHGGCAVEMVEHVLAALAGMQIDNCRIFSDRAEMPGCDGSSEAFTKALELAGREEQSACRASLRVTSPIRVGDADSWIEAIPNASEKLNLTYHLNYPHAPVIGAQEYHHTCDPQTFAQELAPARTFVLAHEAIALKAQGLGQRVTNQHVLVFDEQGPQKNTLRFSDECARHKTLDMIGDFSLAGVDLIGDFTASRSGHRLNSQMVFALLSQAAGQMPELLSA